MKSNNRNLTRSLIWGAIVVAIVVSFVSVSIISTENKTESNVIFNKLTAEEERVIIHKGTEAPFSGELLHNKEEGTYVCKRCDAPLYVSNDKFDSGCGWPSFDDAIPGAVKRSVDADGRRTEITCAGCGAHLGHLFEGEGFTEKNARYCVNSISLDFMPASAEVATEKAYFAGGCFWGVEHLLKQTEGVLSTTVGYMGGQTSNPTYQDVSYKSTGHAEAVEVVYDPTRTNYETLTRLFFEIHDPTQENRQGPDVGDQYRSAIFYVDNAQKQTAEKLIGILEGKGYDVATQLVMADTFWSAEGDHQDYYDKTGKEPYCHVYQKRF